ncbi:MAG TPA: DUF3472 domain-containing protein [Fimbriimonadaceae bacterium]|nr:DUF3472 domain-containing protein [Fimbriimonadaceae bacterium]
MSRLRLLALPFVCAPIGFASAQHLIWKYQPSSTGYTCLYGEIQPIATNKTIYFCGCNWWPGAAAGGYTGIQDPGGGRHNMIFSIWDTSKDLHPKTIAQDERTQANRFGGEGEGAHTHLDYDWQLGKTYQFYAVKRQDASGANTLCTVYFYDDGLKKWVSEATIASPNNGQESVKTFGGMLNSFLENWSGQEREKPKLCLYRLWLGTKPSDLTEVTESSGDGKWGVLNHSFYLAEGEDASLDPILQATRTSEQDQTIGAHDALSCGVAQPLSPRLVRQLEKLK